MATTISGIISKVDLILRDTSNNSVSAADRLLAISTAVQDIMGEFGFDHMNKTYSLSYLDTVNYYKLDTDITDLIEPIDLRRGEGENVEQFTRKNPRELAIEIANGETENAFGIERKDRDTYLVVNYGSPHQAILLHDCDSLTSNGTWAVDATNSDATNLTLDSVEFKQGNGSLNFDADVSQSGDNRATIENSDMAAVDLSDEENLASLVFRVYIPDVTNFSSVTGYWGSSSSAYWSGSATTDINSNAFVNGWNRIKVDWADATQTGTVDESAIDYLRFDLNYTGSQVDDTDFRIDDINMIRPETLTLFYQSAFLGTDTTGATNRTAFSATGDIPFYSGMYDYFDNPVAYRAASILFDEMGLPADSDRQNLAYQKAIRDLKKRFPSSTMRETSSFKVKGINFNK